MQNPYEIFYSKEKNISLEWSGKGLKVREFSESSGYGVRVIKNKRIGFAYTESESGLENALKKAAILSRFSPQSSFSFQCYRNYPRVKTYDQKTSSMDEKSLKEILEILKDSTLKKAKRARIILECGNGSTRITNSEGMDCEYKKTMITIYVEATDADGFGFASYSGISLPKDIETLGENAGEMARMMRGAKKIESGKYTVVFSAEPFHQLLSIVLPSFSGDWKRRKISKLHDKIGKRVFDEKLSLFENGLINGANIRPFDDEGTPSSKNELIEKGVLKGFMYDKETAALAGLKSEGGCCTRASYKSLPGIGCSNLIIKPGDWHEFEKELSECLVVDSIHGVHTANTTNGDFGVEVNIAFHSKKGVRNPKRGFMITGNIFRMLSSIEGIEKRSSTYHNLIYPRLAFREIEVIS